jgi:hypothetical protein
VKSNAIAGLTGRETAAWAPIKSAVAIVEIAAQDESQHDVLMQSGIADSLEYACAHDFTYIGVSTASSAAGAVVSLIGTKEGGKTLSRETVSAVLGSLGRNFQTGSYFSSTPVTTLMTTLNRVATMCKSDANKLLMLEFAGTIDTLLCCLLLEEDDPRRKQDGADALQETAAQVLEELALFGPGLEMLRCHEPAIEALDKLTKQGSKAAQARAAATLFQMRPKSDDGDDDRLHEGASDGGKESGLTASKPGQQHIMISYNWGHQQVILRVVASLKSRKYAIWVDVEKMEGSTVDAASTSNLPLLVTGRPFLTSMLCVQMAFAVEGAAVMLVGLSRAYKESTNCRMEAQYGMQKRRPVRPRICCHCHPLFVRFMNLILVNR